MIDTTHFGLFVAAAIALALLPGPDTLYVAARSLTQGRLAGVTSALGIACGMFVHISATALGLAALVAASATAYTVVKAVGGIYLIYLGVRTLLAKNPSSAERPAAPQASARRMFAQGFITNVLNPKVALFFIAFLPQFVDPHRSIPLQIATLGVIFDAIGVSYLFAVALVAGTAAEWLRASRYWSTIIRLASGSVLVALGLRIVIPERS
ncbi:MAG: LysE family translocator [Vulcanimicrobiaceae bacterium]